MPLARVQAVYAKRLDDSISPCDGVLTPVLITPTPGVAVMGYIHPTKKGTPENYSILLGSLFILSIIITSFRFFNWWGQSEQNILHLFVYFTVFLPIIRRM